MKIVKLSEDEDNVITTVPDTVQLQSGDFITVGLQEYQIRCSEYITSTGRYVFYVDELYDEDNEASEKRSNISNAIILVVVVLLSLIGLSTILKIAVGYFY